MIELDFQNEIYQNSSYETKNWRKILELGDSSLVEIDVKRKLSWVWPAENDLKEIQSMLEELKIRSILSIGCGCGLFEWILRESIGLNIHGLEHDRAWWESNHAVKNFIKLSFIDDLKPNCLPETFLQRCCDIHDQNNWKFAIMFVYFNNRAAFLNYLEMYKGKWIILVGPNCGTNIHTDPLPLEPNFPNQLHWQLCKKMSLGFNVLAIYKKIELT